MSRYFLMGGILGFGLVFFVTLSGGSSIHLALRNGMIGCLVMAVLARLFFQAVARAYVENKLRDIERVRRDATKREETT